jgi:hypothetical protein
VSVKYNFNSSVAKPAKFASCVSGLCFMVNILRTAAIPRCERKGTRAGGGSIFPSPLSPLPVGEGTLCLHRPSPFFFPVKIQYGSILPIRANNAVLPSIAGYISRGARLEWQPLLPNGSV